MGQPPDDVADVRDMLCAQALAVVAQALERGRPGAALSVRYNSQDVKHDLLVWARERGCTVREAGPDILQMAPES